MKVCLSCDVSYSADPAALIDNSLGIKATIEIKGKLHYLLVVSTIKLVSQLMIWSHKRIVMCFIFQSW